MAKGMWGMAEHMPGGIPGMSTTLKGIHGLYDIATGNEKGEYGSNFGDLTKHLFDPRQQNKDDLTFWAGMGGGVQAWKDKPAEAFTRTLTNLAPMVMGAAEGAPERAPGVAAVPEPPISPMAESVPGSRLPGPPAAIDPSLPSVGPEGPSVPSEVPPEPAPDTVKVKPGEMTRQFTPAELRQLQELDDRIAAQDAAQDFSSDPRMQQSNLTPAEAKSLAEDIKNAQMKRLQASHDLAPGETKGMPDVPLDEMKNAPPNRLGGYDPNAGEINLNFRDPQLRTPEGVAETTAHEVRHHIQRQRGLNPDNAIDPDAARQFDENFNRYQSPPKATDPAYSERFRAYEDQLIERDARRAGAEFVDQLFEQRARRGS
jgi:hypothetical protein